MLESVAALDFSGRLTISEKADNVDAVASGLNMLSEELEAGFAGAGGGRAGERGGGEGRGHSEVGASYIKNNNRE